MTLCTVRTTSVYTALKHPEAFKDIPDQHRGGVIDNLKVLQRVQAICPVAEAVPVLMRANLTSGFQVGEIPESTFLRSFGTTLGEGPARQLYTNAINGRIRNEHDLMTMRESMKGTGLAVLDGDLKTRDRILTEQKVKVEATTVAAESNVPLNLDTLFGDMDYCECKDCLSVYSPAAYFVDLLQFLRNNNLDPDYANTGEKGYANTPLVTLFFRRPDLQCLELTCENTFTVLPYVDLVNEVMEKFVVLRDIKDLSFKSWCHSFKVVDETSSELLSEPQHTNYQAYCILKQAVYPFTLPQCR